jgi:hypothetical protein
MTIIIDNLSIASSFVKEKLKICAKNYLSATKETTPWVEEAQHEVTASENPLKQNLRNNCFAPGII